MPGIREPSTGREIMLPPHAVKDFLETGGFDSPKYQSMITQPSPQLSTAEVNKLLDSSIGWSHLNPLESGPQPSQPSRQLIGGVATDPQFFSNLAPQPSQPSQPQDSSAIKFGEQMSRLTPFVNMATGPTMSGAPNLWGDANLQGENSTFGGSKSSSSNQPSWIDQLYQNIMGSVQGLGLLGPHTIQSGFLNNLFGIGSGSFGGGSGDTEQGTQLYGWGTRMRSANTDPGFAGSDLSTLGF